MPILPKLLALGFLFTLLSFWSFTSVLADWTTFRGSPLHSGSVDHTVGELSPIRWTSENIGTIASPPVVSSEEDLYVATANGLTKLNSDGQKMWALSTLGNPSNSPAIDNNQNIYFATSGCNPYVYSVTSAGTLRWQYDLRQGGGQCGSNQSNSAVSFSPDKQTLYVGVDYPGEKLMAFNLSGGVIWQTNLNDQSPGGSSAAITEDGLIYVGTGGNGRLFSLTSGGSIRWHRTVASGPTVRLGTPIIDQNGNIYVTTRGANGGEYISSYDSSGTRRWFYQITGSAFTGEPAVKGNTVYIVESNHLRAINTETGTLTWQWTSPENESLTSPVVDNRGIIYTASGSNVYAVTQTGTTKLTYTIASGLSSPIIPANGLIYLYRNQSSTSNGWLYALGQNHEASYPVIFIPGLGGSEFKAAQDIIWSQPDGHGGTYSHAYSSGEKIWVNEGQAAALGNDDYFDVLRLKSDGETPEADLMLTGNLSPFGYPDIDTFFTNMGYEKDTNFFVFPYDWRKDIRTTKDSLDILVDEAKEKSGMPKVNIIAHSMGGLVARYYIADSTKAVKVGKLISLGVPHLGSVDALKTLMYGKWVNYKVPFLPFISLGIIPDTELKDLLSNFTSIFELLPTSKYSLFYDNSSTDLPYPFHDERDVDTNNIAGILAYDQLKSLLGNLKHNMHALNNAESFNDIVFSSFNQLNSVRLYSIVGSNQPTLGQIKETWWVNWPVQIIPRTEALFINGDGTVPLYSASLKNEEKDISGGAAIYFVEQGHSDLISNSGPAMQTVQAILNEDDILPVQVKDEKIVLEGHHVSIDQDAVLDLYDGSNNHTGLNSNNKVETNIPNTSFDVLENTKHAFIKKSAGKVRVKITSPTTVKTKVKIRQYTNDRVNKTTFYKDVPVSPDIPIEFEVDPTVSTSPQLTVGSQTFPPSSEAVGGAVSDFTPPITTINLSGTKDSSGNFTDNVTVTMSSSDLGSGTLTTEYSVNNGQTAQVYTSPFTVSTPGTTTLKVRAIDKVGNEELPQTISFTILSSSSTTTTTTTSDSNTSSSDNSVIQSSVTNLAAIENARVIKNYFSNNNPKLAEIIQPGKVLGVQLDNPRESTDELREEQPSRQPLIWLTLIPTLTLLLTPLSMETGLLFLKRIPFKNPEGQKINNPKPKNNID